MIDIPLGKMLVWRDPKTHKVMVGTSKQDKKSPTDKEYKAAIQFLVEGEGVHMYGCVMSLMNRL